MKKAGLIVLLLALIGGAAFLAMRNNSESDTSRYPVDESQVPSAAKTVIDSKEPQSVIVTYSDKGFTPNEVIINVGDSVVFKNESSGSFWPASDPHPAHTELSAFDARSAVAPGQSYTMTFEQSGSWGFHNHLNSSEMGNVIVR